MRNEYDSYTIPVTSSRRVELGELGPILTSLSRFSKCARLWASFILFHPKIHVTNQIRAIYDAWFMITETRADYGLRITMHLGMIQMVEMFSSYQITKYYISKDFQVFLRLAVNIFFGKATNRRCSESIIFFASRSDINLERFGNKF